MECTIIENNIKNEENNIKNEENNQLEINNKLENNELESNLKKNDLLLKKKRLIELSKNLTKLEYIEFFNIIKNDNCPYSENKNGIFINLSNISESTINKIYDFIDFIKYKKIDLLKQEEYINNAKKNIIIDNVKKNDIINNSYEIQSDEEINEKDCDYDIEEKSSYNYLAFSSDEDNEVDNKILLKKKKNFKKTKKMLKTNKENNNIL
jgi:hypothetical protein